jgi:hypothetical protein
MASYEYKFAYDSWAGQESLTPGSSCTVSNGGFTNRTLTRNTKSKSSKSVLGKLYSDCPIALEQMDLPVTFDEAGVEYGLIGFGGAENSVITEDPTLPRKYGRKSSKVRYSRTLGRYHRDRAQRP